MSTNLASTLAPAKDAPATSVRKFTFSRSFEAGRSGESEPQKPKPVYTEDQAEQIRREGFEAGFAEGKKVLHDEELHRIRQLMLNVERHLNQLTKAGADVWQNQLSEMQEVALVLARKIMPVYVRRHGLDELRAILERVIGEMTREPRLVVRVGNVNYETLNASITEISTDKAYAGQIVVIADDTFGESDIRVEWADGGIDRDLRSLWFEMDRILEEGIGINPLCLEPPNEKDDSAVTEASAPEPMTEAAPVAPLDENNDKTILGDES